MEGDREGERGGDRERDREEGGDLSAEEEGEIGFRGEAGGNSGDREGEQGVLRGEEWEEEEMGRGERG